MKRALISLAFSLSLGTAFAVGACPPAVPTADGSRPFVEPASPHFALTAISIL